MLDADVVIIGAGVVGLACAERLAREARSVVVLERWSTFGQETSSRNSEVIHAGIYYPTGSLKAELCREGAQAMYAWCEQRGVAHARVGKYIVATCAEEEPALARILAQAHANGATEVVAVSREVVRREEPNVLAAAALWSPNTGIVDSHGFMASLLAAARDHGCEVAWKHRLVEVTLLADGYALAVAGPSGELENLTTRAVVNAAGLRADEVAALAGLDVDARDERQVLVKGSYFRIRGPKRVNHLIYPVPPRDLAGLGLHVTLDLAGVARVGPDVEPLEHRREEYTVDESRRPTFFAAVSRYLSGVREDDLAPDQSGIRPKLASRDGKPRDFALREESFAGLPRWINLLGIESPGLTASLAIAGRVSTLLPR